MSEALIDWLGDAGVPATFFIQGRWAEAYPATARAIAAAGHLVGNHSFYHARMPLLSDDGLAEDVRAAEGVIRDVVGVDPRPWFRCPFGAGGDDARILGGLERLGYRNVGWDIEASDWEPSMADRIAPTVLDGVRARGDGAIVLLHTWPDGTLAALPSIVDRLRRDGATFVTVDQLGPEIPIGPGAPAPDREHVRAE